MKMDVKHIALLARLSLTEEERERFGSQLSSILSYVGKLNEIDTSGIESASHVLEMKNIMREDELRSSLPVDDALMNAPDRSGNFYRVPKIIE